MENEKLLEFKKLIAVDSMFLRNHNLIDYSLLLVIESKQNNKRDNPNRSSIQQPRSP